MPTAVNDNIKPAGHARMVPLPGSIGEAAIVRKDVVKLLCIPEILLRTGG